MTLLPLFFKCFCLHTLVCNVRYVELTRDADPETFDPGTLPADVLESLEADSFWCLVALLDGIQVIALPSFD